MWEKASKTAPEPDSMTLDAVAAEFLAWAETYYRRADGSPTREAVNCELALRALQARCGRFPIDDVSYDDILAAREQLVADGLTRPTVNQRVGVWKRFFAWALENRKCQAATKSEVWAIGSLRRNRTEAPEGGQVGPVDPEDVNKTIPYLTESLRAMVRIESLTGMRPGELCAIRLGDIEKRADIWLYRPAQHKTVHKGNVRVIVIGPRAQAHLGPYMTALPDRPCFRPERGPAGRYWTPSNFAQAIRYAIRQARKAGEIVQDWTPNQLRHACGTAVRRQFGVDAARAVLGHSEHARITDRYTRDAIEDEIIAAASPSMLAIG